MDKQSVEVGESQERAYVGEVDWGLLILDRSDLFWLHAHSIASDDEA